MYSVTLKPFHVDAVQTYSLQNVYKVLLSFIVVWLHYINSPSALLWYIYPYSWRLIRWYWGHHRIALMPVQEHWGIRVESFANKKCNFNRMSSQHTRDWSYIHSTPGTLWHHVYISPALCVKKNNQKCLQQARLVTSLSPTSVQKLHVRCKKFFWFILYLGRHILLQTQNIMLQTPFPSGLWNSCSSFPTLANNTL